MRVRLCAVPFDGGNEGIRMGAGPDHLLRRGAAEALRARGHAVAVERIAPNRGFRAEIRTGFALCRALAGRVRAAQTAGEFPLVLAGNCNSALGTLAGVGAADVGVVWLDGHADCETPETTRGGSLDGMGVSTAVGRCWAALAATVPGFAPIPEDRVLLVGSRQVDPWERALLERSAIAVVAGPEVRRRGVPGALAPALDALRSRVRRVYLHIDLDVLDADWAPANEVAPAAGPAQVEEAIGLVAERFTVAAAALTSYDPAWDRGDRVSGAGLRFLGAIVGPTDPH
jgi:arginase